MYGLGRFSLYPEFGLDNFTVYIFNCRFIEHGEFKGNLYGTRKDSILSVIYSGKVCVLTPNAQVCMICRVFGLGYGYGVKRHFQQYFSDIVEVSFIGGRNRSNWRKPPTRLSQVIDKLYLPET